MNHHLILGGQRSGKSRYAEKLAQQWLSEGSTHRAVVVATALVADDEMRARVARHRLDRPANLDTVEAPLALGAALRANAGEGRLLIVDCLTMWLTNWLMPAQGDVRLDGWHAARDDLLAAMSELRQPVVFVSNEIGWGVIPMSSKVRAFVDELGWLNQAVASRCEQVTLMVAGQPWTRPVSAPAT